jgi:hypothetical protein
MSTDLSRLKCESSMLADSSTKKSGGMMAITLRHSNISRSPYVDLSHECREEIKKLGDDIMAREARREEVQGRLGRLRESLSRRSLEEGPSIDNDVLQSRQEDDSESGREGPEYRGLCNTGAREMLQEKKVLEAVDEFKTQRGQVGDLSATMLEQEELVSKRQADADRLRNELDECRTKAQGDLRKERQSFLGQIVQMAKVIEAKSEEMDHYEYKLLTRDKEVDELRTELADARRKSEELEVQLEVHDFKFTSYQNYQKRIDKQALHKIGEDMMCEATSQESEDSTQQYVGKLVSDLDEMEKMYVQSKIEAADKFAELEQESTKDRVTILSFQRRLAANEKQTNSVDSCGDTAIASSTSASTTSGESDSGFSMRRTLAILKKRMELLEAANARYSQSTKTLKAELKNAHVSSEQRNESGEREMISLRLNNAALLNKISALEIEMGLSVGKIDNNTISKRYKMLEKSLDDYIVEIMRLEDELRMKKRVISRLSTESVEKRIETSLVDSSGMETKLSPRSRQPMKDDQRTIEATKFEIENSASAAELQSQLMAIQTKLKKREETLNYVRASYSGKVAKLKLRIENNARKNKVLPHVDLYFV